MQRRQIHPYENSTDQNSGLMQKNPENGYSDPRIASSDYSSEIQEDYRTSSGSLSRNESQTSDPLQSTVDEKKMLSNFRAQPETNLSLPSHDDGSFNPATTNITPSTSSTIPMTTISGISTVSSSKRKRRGKTKIQYNPEVHCGVLNSNSGSPCMRALTCKAHSMYAKRLVQGRSQPFDVLVAAQRSGKLSKQPGNENVSSISQLADTSEKVNTESVDSCPPLQIEEEIEAILLMVRHSHGCPLAYRAYQVARDIDGQRVLREALKDALSIRPSKSSIGTRKLSTIPLIPSPPVPPSSRSPTSSYVTTKQGPSLPSRTPISASTGHGYSIAMTTQSDWMKKPPKAPATIIANETLPGIKKVVTRKPSRPSLLASRQVSSPISTKMTSPELESALGMAPLNTFIGAPPDNLSYSSSISSSMPAARTTQ